MRKKKNEMKYYFVKKNEIFVVKNDLIKWNYVLHYREWMDIVYETFSVYE